MICGVCGVHAELFVCGLLRCVSGMYVVMLVAWFVCVLCLYIYICVYLYILCLVNVCVCMFGACAVCLIVVCTFVVDSWCMLVCVWVGLLIVLVLCFVIV